MLDFVREFVIRRVLMALTLQVMRQKIVHCFHHSIPSGRPFRRRGIMPRHLIFPLPGAMAIASPTIWHSLDCLHRPPTLLLHSNHTPSLLPIVGSSSNGYLTFLYGLYLTFAINSSYISITGFPNTYDLDIRTYWLPGFYLKG